MTTKEKFEQTRQSLYALALKELHGEEQEMARFLMDFLEENLDMSVKAYLDALSDDFPAGG